MDFVLRTAIAAAALVAFATGASAETISVTIKGMKFEPAEITARVGDTIEWTNQDIVGHTATERGKAWDVVIARGKVGTLLLETPGDIAYFCRFHPTMLGKISVTE